MPQSDTRLVAARLTLLVGEARNVVVASPRSDVDTDQVARDLVESLRTGGHHAAAEEGPSPAGDYRVSAGRGLLDDPGTVSALQSVDGVILVARSGRTMRRDLDECRRLLDAAGVRLIAAILVK